MRKTAKSNRAPLAPLHNNSLRGDSPRKTAKGGGRQSVSSFGHKAAHKLHSAEVTKADKANANLPDRAQDAGSKAARTHSPAKARKSVPLVTTSAVPSRSKTLAKIKQGLKKPAEAPSAKQTAANVPSAVSQLDDLLIRHRAAQQSSTAPQSSKPNAVAPSNIDQAGAATRTTAPLRTDASPPSSVLHHWHVPAAPPSINALLGPSETAAAAISTGRDVQNCWTPGIPAVEVKGVGTPQDFSDVFDLDEVSGQTPGGAVTFAGWRDRSPALILTTPQGAAKDTHSTHHCLSGSPCLTSKKPSVAPLHTATADRQSLATPEAVELLKELRIKTPHVGSTSATTRLRSSPFLAQLLRTAPVLSPAASLASPPAKATSQHAPAAAGQAAPAAQVTSNLQDADPVFGSSTLQGSPDSLAAASSPDPVPARAAASASMESAGSNSPRASGCCHTAAPDAECVTPVLSESAAESAIRQALVRLASSDKVICLMSPVALDGPCGVNPHAPFAASAGSLPKFTLAALDSPPAAAAGSITRQSSGSVNGPEAGACASSPAGHPQLVLPIQEVVDQLLSCPKLAVTGLETAQEDKTPYQTLLQHLMGSGQAAAHSPGAQPGCHKPAVDSPRPASMPAMFPARAAPVMHPVVQATPARHRLAQTTYKTPSTVQEQSSPSQGSFCFASPITDQSSPLATFLHQLTHATYDSQHSPAESARAAQSSAQAEFHSPDGAHGPTPFQDFMKYLTQATYHSPGSKAGGTPAVVPGRGPNSSDGNAGSAGLALSMAAAEAAESPVRLGEEGLAAWLHRSQVSHAIKTPARNQLQEVWRQAGEVKHLSQLLEESSKVGEENAGLRQQLGDIQASLHQLTNTNQATLQDSQAYKAAAAAESEKAKRTAQQLLALAHQTSKVTESYEAERHALRQDVTRAKSQLAEAQTASQAAQAAAHISTQGLAALEKALSTAREELQAAEEAAQAQSQQLTAALQDKTDLEAQLHTSCHQLAAAQAAAAAAGQQTDGELQRLAVQLKEAHEALYEVELDQQQAHAHLAAQLVQQEEENARLRSAIAVSQQQLHEAAAAAEKHVLGEAAQVLQGEQQAINQAHLLVQAQAMQRAKQEENAQLVKQLQEANEQLLAAQHQPISLQLMVLNDSSSRVAATLTPSKAHFHSQQQAASDLTFASDSASQGLNPSEAATAAESHAYPSHMPALCTPASKSGGRPGSECATPQARLAAAHLLRGLGMAQGLALDLGFDLEPEWPAGPPPSLSGSPLMAATPASAPRTLGLQAELVKTLDMGAAFASLGSELSSIPLGVVSDSPEQPKAPLPTPAGTPAAQRLAGATLALGANDIATAFALAHEQLRTSPVTQHKQSRTAISPVSFALPAPQEAATAGDDESPVVKTSRQVSSVLAAVADLEAAQGITGKRLPRRQVTRPVSFAANKLQTPSSANTTPAHRFSTRFIRSPAAPHAVPSEGQSQAALGLSHMANPLYSPREASLDPMLTPFYTPASMSSIRTGYDTPAAATASGTRGSLAGSVTPGSGVRSGVSPAGVGTPGSGVRVGVGPAGVGTPGSGAVTGDWRSVTDRLQALRAQLQSAQKKLKATSGDTRRGSASLAGTPLADITARQQQASPVALPSLTKLAISGPGTASGCLVTPSAAAQESVEEQCLSAGRWLRGLADECLENVYTPARLQPVDIAEDSQAEDDKTTMHSQVVDEQWDAAYIRARELVSHPIVPTSPSSWDQSSVTSSPALSVHSPVVRSVPARVSPLDRLLARCRRAL